MSHTEDRGTMHGQVNRNAESQVSKTDTENTKGLSTKAINCVLLLVPVTEAIKSHSQNSSRSTMSSSPTIRLLSQEAIEGHVPFRWLFCDHHVSPLEFQSFSNSSSSQDQPSQYTKQNPKILIIFSRQNLVQ
jgi:hypothetical protein